MEGTNDGAPLDATHNVVSPVLCLLGRSNRILLKKKSWCSEQNCSGRTLNHDVGFSDANNPNIITAVTFKRSFPTDVSKALESKLKLKEYSSCCQRKRCVGTATMKNELRELPHIVVFDCFNHSSTDLFTEMPEECNWEGRDCRMKLRAVILHSRMENHFTSVACLENHYVYHCGLKAANGKLIPKSEVQGDTVMARNIQGRYYSVCLAIYELI